MFVAKCPGRVVMFCFFGCRVPWVRCRLLRSFWIGSGTQHVCSSRGRVSENQRTVRCKQKQVFAWRHENNNNNSDPKMKQRKHLAQVFLFHISICIEGEKITISTSLPWNEVRSFSDVLMNFTWIEAIHNVLSMPTWLFSWVVNSFLTGWTKGHPEKQWKFNIKKKNVGQAREGYRSLGAHLGLIFWIRISPPFVILGSNGEIAHVSTPMTCSRIGLVDRENREPLEAEILNLLNITVLEKKESSKSHLSLVSALLDIRGWDSSSIKLVGYMNFFYLEQPTFLMTQHLRVLVFFPARFRVQLNVAHVDTWQQSCYYVYERKKEKKKKVR